MNQITESSNRKPTISVQLLQFPLCTGRHTNRGPGPVNLTAVFAMSLRYAKQHSDTFVRGSLTTIISTVMVCGRLSIEYDICQDYYVCNVYGELENISGETVMAYFKVISWRCSERDPESDENPKSGHLVTQSILQPNTSWIRRSSTSRAGIVRWPLSVFCHSSSLMHG